jgi:drug/metabolite transporter (DMT)-like permease
MTHAYLAWITVCIVWGTTYLAIRVALETVPVLLLAGFRWFTAGVLLSLTLLALGRRLPGPRNWGPLLLLAFLMNVLGNGLVVWAELYVASGLTAVVIATVPFWSVVIEAVLPRGERFSSQAIAGLIVGFVGIIVLVWPELTMGGSSGRAFVAGVIALQIACAAWAMGTSYTKRHKVGDDPFATSAVQMVFSGLMLMGFGTFQGEWSTLHFSTRSFLALSYLTLAGSLVAYTAYVYAVKHLPLSTVSLYAYINPVLAVLLGSLVLDEPFSLRIVGAAGLVLGGMWIVSRAPASAPRSKRALAGAEG